VLPRVPAFSERSGIQRGDELIKDPDSASLHFPDSMSNQEIFEKTCLPWPHMHKEGRDTLGCCWQWVEDV